MPTVNANMNANTVNVTQIGFLVKEPFSQLLSYQKIFNPTGQNLLIQEILGKGEIMTYLNGKIGRIQDKNT